MMQAACLAAEQRVCSRVPGNSAISFFRGCTGMTVREHTIRARQFEYEEMSRKVRDLNDLKHHIEMSLDRIAAGQGGGYGSSGSGEERRETLKKSLEDINRQLDETKEAMEAARALLEESENVRDGYNRVPVAVGKGRGRGQVEHIRIVRAQRG